MGARVFDRDVTLMAVDELVSDGEPEPGAAVFGGEERIEHVAARFLR